MMETFKPKRVTAEYRVQTVSPGQKSEFLGGTV